MEMLAPVYHSSQPVMVAVYPETYQKGGSHKGRFHPGRAGSRRQSARRCTGQQDGHLVKDQLPMIPFGVIPR